MNGGMRVLVAFLVGSVSALSSCALEGERCSLPRDCCDGFECAEGDWATTTDFTCKRTGPVPSHEEYSQRLADFYRSQGLTCPDSGDCVLPPSLEKKVTPEALAATLAKWKGREERMFHVLRQKYPGKEEL